ncbi:MAG TPA: tail fiber protein [Thermoanaerobaculia bacterium]|jgi:microcystin-dependent protein|nr:tail fiber protein [Thermoanaerobaculia bacterium]
MPIGEIRLFAASFAPVGWEFCEGQTLNARQHAELASRIGKTFGGDGQETVALPDLRGRAAMHNGNDMKLGNQRTIPIDASQRSSQVPAKVHVNYIILTKNLQRMGEGEPFIGEIRIFAGSNATRGWIPCDGRPLKIFENTPLYALLGNKYARDHRNDIFWVPNLDGRVPVHPPTRDDLGTTADARDFDANAQTKTHLALSFHIAAEGMFPERP